MYFPVHLKYAEIHTEPDPAHGNSSLILRDTTAEWKLAITLAVIVAAHMYVQSACSPSSVISDRHLQSVFVISDICAYRDQQLIRPVDNFPRSDLSGFLRCAVSAAASENVEFEACRQSKHHHNVHPKSRRSAYVFVNCHQVCLMSNASVSTAKL